MRCREFVENFVARNRNSKEIVHIMKVKNTLDVERIESHFSQLKECDSVFHRRYLDLLKKDGELWVFIPCIVDRIDCNGRIVLQISLRCSKTYT